MVGYMNDKREFDASMIDAIDLENNNDDDDDKYRVCNGNSPTSMVDSYI